MSINLPHFIVYVSRPLKFYASLSSNARHIYKLDDVEPSQQSTSIPMGNLHIFCPSST